MRAQRRPAIRDRHRRSRRHGLRIYTARLAIPFVSFPDTGTRFPARRTAVRPPARTFRLNTPPPVSAAPAAPKSFAALRHPGARAYLIGSALAMNADAVEHVISYLIIWEKFHSPTLGGFAVVAHWLPFLLFSIHAGALADRFDPRRVIQAGMVLFMLVSAGWALLFMTNTLEMWHAVVLLIVHGLAGAIWAPAAQLLIHDIVGREQLQSGVRLLATSRTLGIVLGPAVGGGLLVLVGPAWGLFINILIYLPLTLWLWRAPYGPAFRTGAAAAAATGRRAIRGVSDILATMREVAGNRVVVPMTLLAGAAGVMIGNAHHPQMPEFAVDLGTGGDSLLYSILLGANAAGALTAGLVLESRSLLPAKRGTAFVLVFLWCFAMGGFALTGSYEVALALLFVAGFLDLSFNSMAQTLVQLNAAPEIRGRVVGLYMMTAFGLRAVSGVTVGMAGSLIGIHWSLAISAGVLLAMVLALAARTYRPAAA
jgi:MFS family permease